MWEVSVFVIFSNSDNIFKLSANGGTSPKSYISKKFLCLQIFVLPILQFLGK